MCSVHSLPSKILAVTLSLTTFLPTLSIYAQPAAGPAAAGIAGSASSPGSMPSIGAGSTSSGTAIGPGNAPMKGGQGGARPRIAPSLPIPPTSGTTILPGTTPLGSQKLTEADVTKQSQLPSVKGEHVDPTQKDQEGKDKAETTEPGEDDKRRGKLSDLEVMLSGRIASTLDTNIIQFGYDMFANRIETFMPLDSIPVGPDYILGPGDEWILTMSGMIEEAFVMRVSREGIVNVPRVGPVVVAGLHFGELEAFLTHKLTPYYKTFKVTITMSKLRTTQVFVVGEVTKPGSYQVSSLSTAIHALWAAGGIKKTGSLRLIKIIRNNKVIEQLDLYDFLISGSRAGDTLLQPGDIINVPLIGSVVGISGMVRRPGIYELLGRTSLETALTLAGGINPNGQANKVSIERTQAHLKRTILDVDTGSADYSQVGELVMSNLDLVKIYPINSVLQDTVYLSGHVARPGAFQWKTNQRVTDLVSWDNLLPQPYLDYARIIRDVPPDHRKEIVPFHLGKALDGDPTHDVLLQPLDELWIYSRLEIDRMPKVSIYGEVRNPGEYFLLDGTKVSDLIYNAGGLTEIASMKEAELTSYDLDPRNNEVSTSHLLIDLDAAMNNQPGQNIPLKRYDILSVKAVPQVMVGHKISLSGEVKHPGIYPISPGERLSSVLRRAGGLTKKAYLPSAVFTRESLAVEQKRQMDSFFLMQEQKMTADSLALQTGGSLNPEEIRMEQSTLAQRKEMLHRVVEKVQFGRMVIELNEAETLEGTTMDILLEDKDKLHVPTEPTAVGIIGSVYQQVAFAHDPKLTGEDYVERAGGYLEDAAKGSVYVMKANGSARAGKAALKQIEAGDVIVVPQKTTGKVRVASVIRDIATVVGSFSITAAALSKIF